MSSYSLSSCSFHYTSALLSTHLFSLYFSSHLFSHLPLCSHRSFYIFLSSSFLSLHPFVCPLHHLIDLHLFLYSPPPPYLFYYYYANSFLHKAQRIMLGVKKRLNAVFAFIIILWIITQNAGNCSDELCVRFNMAHSSGKLDSCVSFLGMSEYSIICICICIC